MVDVHVKIKNNEILEVLIKGHADSGPLGQDLVCAGVSVVAVGLLNSLEDFSPKTCELFMDEGFIKMKVEQSNQTNQLILAVGIKQLETIEETYSKFICITKQEV